MTRKNETGIASNIRIISFCNYPPSESLFIRSVISATRMITMKQKIAIIVSVWLTVCTVSNLRSQWVQTNGPYGGKFKAFTALGTDLFASVVGEGVYRSTNNGISWNAVNRGLSNPDIRVLGSAGSNIFAGTGITATVFVSSDSGASWNASDSGITGDFVTAFASIGSQLFVETNKGIFLSSDNGKHWKTADSGLTTANI